LLALSIAIPLQAALRPNVIVILSDDQGSVDAGCYGAKDLLTPNIDSLAAHGVRFTQFYAAAPVCSPSRAALLTGRYPLRCGIVGNAASQHGGKGALPSSEVTMAEMFKAAGYATAHVGKWHLGYTADTLPTAQGFDFSFGHMGRCIDNFSHFFHWSGPSIHDLHRRLAYIHLAVGLIHQRAELSEIQNSPAVGGDFIWGLRQSPKPRHNVGCPHRLFDESVSCAHIRQ
jgi:arylsulfatase A-like enzyme